MTWMSSLILNWMCKIHNIQKKICTFFYHICKESKLIIWINDAKIKQSRQKQKNHAPPQSMLQWPCKCAIISFFQYSNVNILELPITCSWTVFMAWVFMMLQIKYVIFILGLGLKGRRVWTTFHFSSFFGSMTRGTILNHTVKK